MGSTSSGNSRQYSGTKCFLNWMLTVDSGRSLSQMTPSFSLHLLLYMDVIILTNYIAKNDLLYVMRKCVNIVITIISVMLS